MTVLISILDKLINNDEYDINDKYLTDINIGAKKNRNIRDNIFVINAMLNNVLKRKLEGTDIQIMAVIFVLISYWLRSVY